MQIIKYKFADGTTNEVSVSEEFYLLYLQLVQIEKRNHLKETRRHISLEYLNENGIDIEDEIADTLAIVIRREKTERVQKAVSTLSDKRRELIHKAFYEELSMRTIAATRHFAFFNIATNENDTQTAEKGIKRLYIIFTSYTRTATGWT